MPPYPSDGRWRFWIDRGGTFTDVVARTPKGKLVTHKLLSDNPTRYKDAAIQGVRDVMGVAPDEPIPAAIIDSVRMGTTVATNALLERRGEKSVLAITAGFGDALRIGYQNRPDLFAREIVLPDMLYSWVIEVPERVGAQGEVILEPDLASASAGLEAAFNDGCRSAAIAFMHGYRYPDHEKQVARLARDIGYEQISVSHKVSPLMKLVPRGDTTMVDAYLSPILKRYVDSVAKELQGARLFFMQSHGGLTDARRFQGKDSILSGPAGGVVGMARTAAMAGFDKVIGFDMGGTSTDVALFDGTFERVFETQVAGVRIRSPMMRINTVAAGGGSILKFQGGRFQVGPGSAGAQPGPACYRKNGPLTVTDCNVMLGRIQPRHFPWVFGPGANKPLDRSAVRRRFGELARQIGDGRSPEQVAEGFLTIAVENMANAIKTISVQRGHDVTEFALNCFGGAGGQHACRVADALGVATVLIHPFAGVLSAYGMGLAEIRAMREQAIEAPLSAGSVAGLGKAFDALEKQAVQEVQTQGVRPDAIQSLRRMHVKYQGTDTALQVDYAPRAKVTRSFEKRHRERFGFAMPEKSLVVEAISVEAVGQAPTPAEQVRPVSDDPAPPEPADRSPVILFGEIHHAPVYRRADLNPGDVMDGPALIVEANATTVVEPGWAARVTELAHLVLTREAPLTSEAEIGTGADPVMLEVFNNLFMSIAEQMGATLANTAHSVNIKERLDFSCALFDAKGDLVANAPHVPVHLGSMGESVKAVLADFGELLRPGDAYVMNAPYNGGTHLPDITVITPVFDETGKELLFLTASRGHHADVGGITPGSMPAESKTVDEEGVVIQPTLLVEGGRLREADIREILASGPWPARNPDQNMADLAAQAAANEKGARELAKMVAHFGLDAVRAYMGHVQANAEESVRRVIKRLSDGAFELETDTGAVIKAAVKVNKRSRTAVIDFTGTSDQREDNFNAPFAVCQAAVLYVFRTLVEENIPLNAGCLKPLKIVAPEGCLLNPVPPAAVVAGNVETSQAVVDALMGALGAMASSQGTMNNLTFGNDEHQYYETICGGSGAGPDFDGTDAVHTHMTNSRLTDPEVLEWRHPVRVESFSIRRGSGGNGLRRGGDGVVRKIRFLEPMEVSILSSRRNTNPHGLEGGGNGAPGVNAVARDGANPTTLSGTVRLDVGENDVISIETPGGGGFGDPE